MSTSNRPKTAWTMLFRVVDRLRAKSARNVSIPNMKITLGKIRIINYLFVREGEPPMLKEIAETFGLTSGAVSQTVDALAADGVVERIPSAVDRRSVHITLTPFGLSIRKQLESYLTDVMSGILDDVPEDKQEAFMEVLQDMSETFTETQRIARETIKR
ncbi:MAG: MarR family winged helix-turn-helix transcriptional regulator [Lentisphaeria bacterium]|nr:winged helix-turn-helix transcriptional regulator [Lentisphaeria bacterium]MDD6337771.1 MarR family winged helix-turn-helix transcriptional regulator [Lentisphaeria bacterium]